VNDHRPSPSRFLGAAILIVALALAAACGDARAEGDHIVVTMADDNRFEPQHLTIRRGVVLTWKNSDNIPHTTTASPALALDSSHVVLPPGADMWDSGLVDAGEDWSRRFDEPGEYTYFCIPHETAGMIGRITVE
jgi:plastocyanin